MKRVFIAAAILLSFWVSAGAQTSNATLGGNWLLRTQAPKTVGLSPLQAIPAMDAVTVAPRYSCRTALIGSMRDTRRAGTMDASAG